MHQCRKFYGSSKEVITPGAPPSHIFREGEGGIPTLLSYLAMCPCYRNVSFPRVANIQHTKPSGKYGEIDTVGRFDRTEYPVITSQKNDPKRNAIHWAGHIARKLPYLSECQLPIVNTRPNSYLVLQYIGMSVYSPYTRWVACWMFSTAILSVTFAMGLPHIYLIGHYHLHFVMCPKKRKI